MFRLGDSGVLAGIGNCRRGEQRYAWEGLCRWQLMDGYGVQRIEQKGGSEKRSV
jgi:hypothetical protein